MKTNALFMLASAWWSSRHSATSTCPFRHATRSGVHPFVTVVSRLGHGFIEKEWSRAYVWVRTEVQEVFYNLEAPETRCDVKGIPAACAYTSRVSCMIDDLSAVVKTRLQGRGSHRALAM